MPYRGLHSRPAACLEAPDVASRPGETVTLGTALEGIGRGTTAWAVLALAGAPELSAQVGLSSQVAQVSLVARVAPGAMLHRVSPRVERIRSETSKDVSVSVGLVANSGYCLVVVGTDRPAGTRLWVRGMDGTLRELANGAAVTVARDGRMAGAREREVSYRVEVAEPDGMNLLPVRYEIRVEPTI